LRIADAPLLSNAIAVVDIKTKVWRNITELGKDDHMPPELATNGQIRDKEFPAKVRDLRKNKIPIQIFQNQWGGFAAPLILVFISNG
jgi:hypothetical protein